MAMIFAAGRDGDSKRNRRIGYAIAFVVFFMVELFIALYVRDRFIRPYVGDMLVVVLVYCFVRIFIPKGCRWLPLAVFAFAVGVEILQYFQIVKLLGLEQNRILRTIIGSVFDWKDIFCYGIGSMVLGIYEFCFLRQTDPKREDR